MDADEFIAWQADRKIIMVEVDGDLSVKAFVKNSTGQFPYMCVYWNKEDGQVVKTLFSGRSGKMPATSGTLARQLIDSVEMDIADYSSSKYNGGTFVVGNAANSRLEAEIGLTEYVDVPLTRETSGVATNWIDVAGAKTEIVWTDNETNKAFRYAIPAQTAAGKIPLTLYDADGTTAVATSAITCTNRPNSISYPYWLGERTAETLNYGEWTMDLAVAKEKAAKENGFVLMNLGGDLWCPDCVSAADSLYADAAFTKWSQDNKVALVAVDVPRSTNLVEASLLTYVAGGKWNKSGAFYRSSKMISDSTAKKQLETNWLFATNTYKLASSSGWRVSVPVMVLLRLDGSVVGHFMAKEGGVGDANGIYTYDTAENIARLNELLALANQPGGKDNEAHRDPSTTKLTHKVGVGETALTLQINDNAWFYKLDDLAAGKVSFTATTADGAPDVSLELFTSPFGRYGDTNNVVSLAKGAGTLTTAIDAATIASNVYLRVGAYPNATGSDTRGKDTHSFANASSLFDVKVTSTLILVPEQISQTVTLGTTSVAMEIAEGSLYKLSGFDATSLATYFTASNDLYVAKATNAAATLNLASSATEVSYQRWRPGVVQFAKASDRMMEMDGSGTVTVTRTGGKSGAITVSVSVDDGANGTKRVSVSPTTLTWPEGDTMAKTMTCTIQQHAGFNKDEVFTLSLAADDATQFGAQKTLALTVTDTDKPVLASDAFTVNAFIKTKEEIAYDVFNIQGNGTLTLKKSGSLPSGMKLAYDKKTRKVVLSGTPKKAGTYKTTMTLKERRNGKYETGPATTFTIIVRDPSSSSSMAGYGVANAYYGKSLSQEIPLINPENGRMEGLLSVAISKANRVSARYTNLNNKKTSFSGAVNGYDAEEGLIASETSKSSSQCAVALSSDGSLSAEVVDAVRDVTLQCEGVDIAAANKSAYAGTYTVTFPRAGTNAAEVAAGTAYATLKITSAGTARYSGVMPNGTTFSGSTKIIAGEDAALVSVFKTSKSGTISALLNVLPNAKEQYESNNPAIIQAEEGTVPFWSCTKGIATEEELKAYGGYYAKDINLESLCTELYAKSVFTLDLGVGELDWTGSATQIASVPDIEVTVKKSSFSLQASKGVSFSKSSSTGILSGKVPLTLANGKTLKAKFKGILLLGWEDCNCGETPIVSENRPFASGTCYFTDTMNGVKVTRSIPVDLNVKTDCEE